MMSLPRRLLPRTLRVRLWRVREGVVRAHLRRRNLRLPIGKTALALGALRVRHRRSTRERVGVDRLEAILVINLDRRPERLAGFMQEMSRLHIQRAERFRAIDDESGIRGCTRSHAAVMRQMIDRGWKCIMVCEDDARFAVGRDQLDALVEAFLSDGRAEVACLAYWHREIEPYSALYLRTTRSFTTACYLVKASIAADLLAVWEEGSRQLALGGDREIYGVDHVWNGLQRTRTFLIPLVRAVRQEAGYSDIWEQHVESAF